MRFEVDFVHPKTGDHRQVVVDLTPDEISSARLAGANVDVMAKAYALRRAYGLVPTGFMHDCGGIVPVAQRLH